MLFTTQRTGFQTLTMPATAATSTPGAIRNISDTARWAALHRARETERPDALFHDPLARTLAGERGERISAEIGRKDDLEWPWVMRTLLFDQIISEQIAGGGGVDMVINLAAGFDARPYRMALPRELKWIEVDLPELLQEKAALLKDAQPSCVLERVPADLADAGARAALLGQLAQHCRRALVISEGLVIYLSDDEVEALGRDIAQHPSLRFWAMDLVSPGLLRILKKKMGSNVAAAGAPFKFGPAEGPLFFERCGWKVAGVHSLLKEAARCRRVSWFLRLMAKLPESSGKQGRKPWGGVCLLEHA